MPKSMLELFQWVGFDATAEDFETVRDLCQQVLDAPARLAAFDAEYLEMRINRLDA